MDGIPMCQKLGRYCIGKKPSPPYHCKHLRLEQEEEMVFETEVHRSPRSRSTWIKCLSSCTSTCLMSLAFVGAGSWTCMCFEGFVCFVLGLLFFFGYKCTQRKGEPLKHNTSNPQSLVQRDSPKDGHKNIFHPTHTSYSVTLLLLLPLRGRVCILSHWNWVGFCDCFNKQDKSKVMWLLRVGH